jgi:hypothetical protein
MILSLLMLGLLVVVAIRVATQGFFGALVNVVLAITCAAAAIGMHEYIVSRWLAGWLKGWNPDYALPIAITVLFAVPFLVFRLVFDKLFRRACLLPSMVDKVGGGVCAVMTAMIVVGMGAIILQTIPFTGGQILGWSRVDAVQIPERQDQAARAPEPGERGLCFGLSPDKFTAGLVSVISSGIMNGTSQFYKHHPDFVQELGWVNSVHAEISRLAPPRSISIVRTRPLDYVFTMVPGNERNNEPATYEPQPPSGGNVFRIVRLNIRPEARDIRKSIAFSLRQIRVVGRIGSHLEQYHAVAVQQSDANDPVNRHVRFVRLGGTTWPVIDERWTAREDNGSEVEVVFELPQAFEPDFLEYKYGARTALSFSEPGGETVTESRRPPPPTVPAAVPVSPAAESAPTAAADAPDSGSRRRRTSETADSNAGRDRRARVQTVGATEGSHFGDELPIALRQYDRLGDTQIEGDRFAQGHLVAVLADQETGVHRAVTRFAVPEGQRLLQLSSVRLQARSTLGRALSSAIGTVQNFFVTDANGKRYSLVGKYAIAQAGGSQVFEAQYYSEPTGTIGGLGKLNRIDEGNLSANDTYVLLFLVDPGVQIVSFSSGGTVGGADDLTAENLVAPR